MFELKCNNITDKPSANTTKNLYPPFKSPDVLLR